jgi:hypothetical protein
VRGVECHGCLWTLMWRRWVSRLPIISNVKSVYTQPLTLNSLALSLRQRFESVSLKGGWCACCSIRVAVTLHPLLRKYDHTLLFLGHPLPHTEGWMGMGQTNST